MSGGIMALSLLASNNAQTVLSSGISSTATTLTVNTGTGSLFPSPVSDASFFKLTLVDAATGTLTEIVHVTQRSGDAMTIVRGQEGTTSRIWSANDIAANMMTAGTLSYMLQSFQPTNANLTSLAALNGLADRMPYFTAAETMALATLTAAGRGLINKASVADIITYLGVLKTSNNLSEIAAAGADSQQLTRTNLGLGTAATASIGTAANQVPDMNSFALLVGNNTFAQSLPSGAIWQIGVFNISSAASGASVSITFPKAFPQNCVAVIPAASNSAAQMIGSANITATGATIYKGSGDSSTRSGIYLAIGN